MNPQAPSEVVGLLRPERLLLLDSGWLTRITNLLDSSGEFTDDLDEAVCAVAPCPQGGWYSVDMRLVPDITVH